MNPIQIFDKFKTLHPNNRERFLPTDSNVSRWQWHIKQMTNQPTYKRIVFRASPKWDRTVKAREVSTFDEMPKYMRDKYGEIASHFPGHRVFACGSRVRGDYVEKWHTDEIRKQRKEAFKADKIESDFDFFVDGSPHPIGTLPVWADYMHGTIHENKFVEVATYDFSRLPQHEHGAAIKALERNDIRHILELHNKYELSPYNYCCEFDGLQRWFQWAIENGLINDQTDVPTKGGQLVE